MAARSKRAGVLVAAICAAIGLAIGAPLAVSRKHTSPHPNIAIQLPAGYTVRSLPPIDADALAAAVMESTGAQSVTLETVYGPDDDLGSRVMQLRFDHPRDPSATAVQLQALGPLGDLRPSPLGSGVLTRRGTDELFDASAIRATGNVVQVVLGGTNAHIEAIMGGLVAATTLH